MAAMFLPTFFGSCFGGHDEASLLAFEALRGSPRPARGQALDAKRTVDPFMRPCFLSVFEPHFRGQDEAVFGCKKSIHYQMSQHEQQVTSNSTNIKQLSNATPKSRPQ